MSTATIGLTLGGAFLVPIIIMTDYFNGTMVPYGPPRIRPDKMVAQKPHAKFHHSVTRPVKMMAGYHAPTASLWAPPVIYPKED